MSEAHRDEIAKLEALYSERPEGRVFTHLAEAYRKAGEPERALEVLREGLDRHQDYSSAHVVHGRVLQDMGRSEEAETAFSRVLELDAQNLVALRGLGTIAAEHGDGQRALDYYRRVIEIDPSDEEILASVESLERGGAGAATGGDGAAGEGSMRPDTGVEAGAGPVEAPAETDEFPHHELPETELLIGDDMPADLEAEPAEPGSIDLGLASLDEALGQAPTGFEEASRPAEEDGEETEPALGGLDDGPGPAMVGREVDALGAPVDEPPADEPAERDGAVVTETMGDVYARQGLYPQAAEVYEKLLRQRPGDERLQSKLDEARSLAGPEPEATWEAAPDTAAPGTEPEDVTRDDARSVPDERVVEDDGLGAWVAPTEEEATASAEPLELEDVPASETEDAQSASIVGLESGEFEPPAEPEVETLPMVEGFETEREGPTGEELSAEPLDPEQPEEEEPVSPETELDALDIGPTPDYEAVEWELASERPDVEGAEAEPAPEELAAGPADEAGAPDRFEAPASPPPDLEVEEPAAASGAGITDQEPWAQAPEAQQAEADEPEAETVESVWTGASGATVGEETPYAWAAESQEVGAEDDEDAGKAPIGEYLQGLLDWRAKGDSAPSGAIEEAAADSVGAEPEPAQPTRPVQPADPVESAAQPTQPAERAEPTQPAEPAAGREAAGGSEAAEAAEEEAGDDDLDMFRSWLESLKR